MGDRELISIDEARERVLAAVRPLPVEDVPLDAALGRILGADAVAAEDLPPFAASAMDGFAVPDGEAGALTVVGESRAGEPAAMALGAGQAIRISTGAVVPEGTHAVVPVERTGGGEGGGGSGSGSGEGGGSAGGGGSGSGSGEGGGSAGGGGSGPGEGGSGDGDGERTGERVSVPASPAGDNVRRAGEDIRAGAVAIAAGAAIGPAEVAVLAALGLPRVACAKRPRVAVLATGDELVEPGAELGPGQIRNSNAYGVAAQAARAGADVVERAQVRDDAEATRTALAAALDSADVVCVTGGVSVGPHDHVKPALAELGVDERFWGVRLQPGKPTWFGARDGRLVFGLPGNPVSAMVTFQLFALPALRALQGADAAPRAATARLAEPVRRNPRRDQMLRVRLDRRDDGWHAARTKEQLSHVLTSMLGADALARIPAGEGDMKAGERIDIELL